MHHGRLVATAAMLVSLALTGPASAAQPSWEVQAGPPDAAHLTDVTVIGNDELWAIGTDATHADVIVHRSAAGTWLRTADVPDDVSLSALAARAGSVWAVGWRTLPDGSTRGVVMVGDGTQWRLIDVAPPGSRLLDVNLTSDRNVWMSGDVDGHVLALHYDGDTWRSYRLAPGSATSVATTRAGDAWMTTWDRMFHWTGSRWIRESFPGSRIDEMTRVTATPDGTGVWVAGFTYEGCCSIFPALAYRTSEGWKRADDDAVSYGGFPRDLLVDRTTHELVVVGDVANCISGEECPDPVPFGWGWSNGAWNAYAIDGQGSISAVDGDGHGGRYAVGTVNGRSVVLHLQRP